jgi:hypothetical protein
VRERLLDEERCRSSVGLAGGSFVFRGLGTRDAQATPEGIGSIVLGFARGQHICPDCTSGELFAGSSADPRHLASRPFPPQPLACQTRLAPILGKDISRGIVPGTEGCTDCRLWQRFRGRFGGVGEYPPHTPDARG